MTARFGAAGASDGSRGVFGGGGNPTIIDSIDYITISTTSDATDFGELHLATRYQATTSNGSRGIFAGGQSPTATSVNNIQYINIPITGKGTDFGDLTGTNVTTAGFSGD